MDNKVCLHLAASELTGLPVSGQKLNRHGCQNSCIHPVLLQLAGDLLTDPLLIKVFSISCERSLKKGQTAAGTCHLVVVALPIIDDRCLLPSVCKQGSIDPG